MVQMWCCSKIMYFLRDLYLIFFLDFEGVVDQVYIYVVKLYIIVRDFFLIFFLVLERVVVWIYVFIL